MKRLTTFTLAALLLAPLASLSATEVAKLRCEYLKDPLGIDVAKPRLSWKLETGNLKPERGVKQTAYQVLVASTPELLAKDQGDLWDNGKVESDQSIQVEYQGKPLESRMQCYWKVRVWDQARQASAWSVGATWGMGLLRPEDWQAKWIGYDAAYQSSPEAAADDKVMNIQGLKWVRVDGGNDGCKGYLRRRIELPEGRKVRRAVLALYAYNFCEAAVNGVPVGQAMHWDRTARLDVTKALRSGVNLVALVASHTDPYNPAVIGRLVLQFESGEDLVIPIDDKWKASQQAADGWEKSTFDDAAWKAAQVIDGTAGRRKGSAISA